MPKAEVKEVHEHAYVGVLPIPPNNLCRIQQPQNYPSSIKECNVFYFEVLTRNEVMYTSTVNSCDREKKQSITS